MIQRTRSPIDTIPTGTPFSTTGRWRKRWFVIMDIHSSTVFSRVTKTTGLVMISLTNVSFEDHFAGIVALRQDADQAALGHDEQCADALHRHLLDGLVHGLIGRYGQDPTVTLALQQQFDCVSDFHEAPMIVYFAIRNRNSKSESSDLSCNRFKEHMV